MVRPGKQTRLTENVTLFSLQGRKAFFLSETCSLGFKLCKVKRVGIYGGTFDPVHHAHLILAREAVETLKLETLTFVPAAISPHKTGTRPTSGDLRLEMLRAAIQEVPEFSVDPIELGRPAPSFTVETIEMFRASSPDTEFYYLVGEDNVGSLRTWHRFDDLNAMVRFVVLDRTGLKTQHPYPTIGRRIDISATEIRNRVASGKSIRYLVPEPVETIIRNRHLYTEP